jgi:hypothetical protein
MIRLAAADNVCMPLMQVLLGFLIAKIGLLYSILSLSGGRKEILFAVHLFLKSDWERIGVAGRQRNDRR